jgi:hypothetical protein
MLMGAVLASSDYYPNICLDGIRESLKNVREYIQSLD